MKYQKIVLTYDRETAIRKIPGSLGGKFAIIQKRQHSDGNLSTGGCLLGIPLEKRYFYICYVVGL